MAREPATPPAPAPETPVSTPETPAAPPPAPTIDTSGFVTREQYEAQAHQLARMEGMLQGALGAQRPAPAPSGPQYTDDQLAEMLESGEGRKVLEAQRYIAQQQMAPFAREFVQFRDATTATAANINREVAVARGFMPHADDPAVKRSMDEFLGRLPADALANPETLKLAYAHAVAQPENFQRLIDAKVEAELRRRAGGDEPVGATERTTPTSRVPSAPGSEVPTVSALLGADAAETVRAAMRAKGYTSVDQWVRASQGGRYKNWPEMAKAIQADQAASAGNGADDDLDERYLQ